MVKFYGHVFKAELLGPGEYCEFLTLWGEKCMAGPGDIILRDSLGESLILWVRADNALIMCPPRTWSRDHHDDLGVPPGAPNEIPAFEDCRAPAEAMTLEHGREALRSAAAKPVVGRVIEPHTPPVDKDVE